MSSTLLFIISILCTPIKGNFAQPPGHRCATFNCGNDVVIRYPLCHHGQQLEHSGYQGLNLTCNNQNPALNISNTLHNIKSINYSDNSLIIPYPNQIIKEQSCPKLPNNLLRASSFDRVLTEGFKLTWRSPAAGACQACEASNSDGLCGYSTNGTGSQEFFCTCPDGRHSISCYGDGVVMVVPGYFYIAVCFKFSGALTVGGGLIIGATVSYIINKKRAASYKPISH
ncbi:hypothetical protein WN944_025332 [Citrus x changshan-huyou]|uniref:non-specific serine/threonine protein kinase n=1 Tax=Citrus x changshan-huyou TaxID=2935761 RepID=A0AAP0LQH0_9ROSI